jgi:hypothetical protein
MLKSQVKEGVCEKVKLKAGPGGDHQGRSMRQRVETLWKHRCPDEDEDHNHQGLPPQRCRCLVKKDQSGQKAKVMTIEN